MDVTRILLQTVGTGRTADPNRPGDRGNPVWEALAAVVRERRPELVVQLCSPETFSTTIPRFVGALDDYNATPTAHFRRIITTSTEPDVSGHAESDAEVRVLPAHHDDVDALARVYTRLIDELRDEFPSAFIEVDFTSGTKAMSSALVFAAVSRRVGGLVYATGDRDSGGRVQETKTVHVVSPGPLVADDDLAELGWAFDQGQFLAVSRQATHIADDLREGDEAQRARTLARLAALYEAWDRFDWKRASRSIVQRNQQRRFSEELQRHGWNAEMFLRQMAHLEDCSRESFSADRLVDLLQNARRRHDRGRYDDCVARLYRLIEYLAQTRFASRSPALNGGNPSNPTKSVSLALLKEHGPVITSAMLESKAGKDGTVSLGLEQTLRWLAEAGDRIAMEFLTSYDSTSGDRRRGPLGNLLQLRNDSLLAHGLSPIGEDGSRDLLTHTEQLVRLHIKDIGLEDDALFARSMFLKCPWSRSRATSQAGCDD